MALFDYLVIAFALLFTAAAMRLIGGLSMVLAPGKRYWIHSTYTLLYLVGVAMAFWNFWSLKDVDWNLPKFLFALSMPGINYYLATLMVPDQPDEIDSWRDYFYSVRVRLFTGIGLLISVQAFSAWFLSGMTLTHPARIGDAFFFIHAILGASFASPCMQAILVIAFGISFIGLITLILAEPGALSN